jgi:hypothetical protein
MLLALFQFRYFLSWKFNADDPSLFILPEANEWALLSPLLYNRSISPDSNGQVML